MNDSWKETIAKSARPALVAATVAISVLALFLLVATIDGLHNWGQPDTGATNTITVTGQGKANAIPDTASVSFTASANAADVSTAQKDMNASVNVALASIKDAGVSDKDVTTSSFNVSPQYEQTKCTNYYCPNTGKIIGYTVSETVQVKIHDTSKVATVLDGLAKAKVTNVSGPNLVVDDPTSVMQQARGEAIKNARANAEKLASQLGVHLGKVVSFQEGNNSPLPMYEAKTAAGAVSASSVAPTIPVGQNEYDVTVTVTYAIR